MIIARCEVTLSSIRDIQSVAWYYKLQSSTLAKPAKPTTKVPSGWDDTEPTYTAGSTNSLYVVELTEYTDETWEYSEVSLSSSYEAAKEAYNKAMNAADAAEAAQNALDISLDVITGTQTAATGAWTGNAKFSELKDGQQIVYWLPYAGSGNATLNLTLADGTTTGAKNCYYGGTTRITTHYPAGSAIRLVYCKAAKVGSATYEGWWADANYDSGNTYDRTRYQQAIKCGTTAIVAANIIVGSDGVYKHLKAGTAFDITYQILYAGSAIAASATGTNNYVTIAFAVTTTQSITLTAYEPVYIKGKLSGTSFTPVSTAPLTQTIPTTADGYHYILLGQAYSTTGVYLLPEHPIFMYYNGAFKSFEQIAAEAAIKADEVEENVNSLTKTVFSASTPTDTSVLWIDTSQSPPVAKRYNPDTVAWEIVNDTTEIIQSIQADVKSLIDQLPDQISMSVQSQTYLKGEVDTLVSELRTMLTQTDDELSFTLTQLQGSIEDVDGKIDTSLENYETYFKFRESGMYIGKSDSVIKLRLTNDRMSFLEGDVEVAYISNRKMYITELEVTGDIIWDGWGLTHESNSSRSFGKIRG